MNYELTSFLNGDIEDAVQVLLLPIMSLQDKHYISIQKKIKLGRCEFSSIACFLHCRLVPPWSRRSSWKNLPNPLVPQLAGLQRSDGLLILLLL